MNNGEQNGGGQADPVVNEPVTGTSAEVFEESGQQQQQADDGQQQQQQQTTTPVKEMVSVDAVRDIIRAEREEATRAGQTPKEYTPEELDQMFDVWKPQMNLVTAIREGDEKAALDAMVELRNGLLRQSNKMTEYQLRILKEELRAELAPAARFAQEQAANKDREAFFTAHPDLKDHEQLVTTVFNALRAEAVKTKTVPEAYKLLADRTRALLTRNGGNGSGDGQSSAAHQQNNRQKPAALSTGSQAGGGGGNGSARTNVFQEIFSED